ncbi:calcium-binding protein [Nitrosomonas nitrosa]|jgi:serralysin|uniref:calcium-binding protein n=1 Tax=Nitrosomonas nitrosa TaxID=52442 RepID=UPI0023F69288|nr:calcium-binding protein [Nitrosomonas nitrosa]MCO6434098.1 calcium-binding protein [Nitrosomonas nitrosa]
MAFHLYRINELYSDVTGTIQFIEMSVGSFNGESFWINQTISVTQGGTTHAFRFPSNLPNTFTANTTVLIATQGFANLGIVTPDFIVPDGFLFTNGGATVNFAGVDQITYSSLPLDGIHSINRSGDIIVNSPKNFAGVTGTIQSNTIAGTDGPDNLTGTAGNDTILAKGGNDTLNGLAGDDLLDGGAGADIAIYNGPSAAYAVNRTPSGFSVSGPEGNDTLIDIERFDFQDRNLAFDLAQGQAAGNSVRIIGAAFDTHNIIPEYVGIGLQLFDSGQSMLEVSELVVNTPLFISLAGSSSNVDFVNLVYQNVVGEPPVPSERDFYVGLLQGSGGTMTQAELLMLAANTIANEVNIDLVGLNQSGVEFIA